MYALSWRVWTYQDLYPAVPFFSWIPYLGPVPSWLLFAAMLVSFTLCLTGADGEKKSCAVYVASSVLLILQDQHRLQPWAYQFMLCAAILSWAEEEDRPGLLLLLTGGIYFHSGLQKLNSAFVHGTGSVLLGVFLKPFGVTPDALPPAALSALTLGMGAFELGLAPGLWLARTRRWAARGALAMHVAILFCLGPWNLAWNLVVWPWNLLMMACAWRFAASDAIAPPRRSRVLAAVLLAVLAPFLRFADRWDSYPSFGLYVDYYHQTDFYAQWDVRARLPETIARHLEKPAVDAAGRVWSRLNLIEWSVAAVEVPPYLENRDNSAVAAAVCRRYRLGDGAALELGGLPPVFGGDKVKLAAYAGCFSLAQDAERYALNARAVDNLGRVRAPAFALTVPSPSACERVFKADDAAAEAAAAAARAPGADPESSVRCLDAAAGYFALKRDFARAERLYVESLGLYASALPDELGRRDALRALAIVYVYQGRLADAEKVLRDWREDSRRRLGAESADEAYALQSLGLLEGAQGRVKEARESYLASIALYRKLLPYHPGVSDGLAGLAALSIREKKFGEALTLMKEAVETKIKMLGPKHPSVAPTAAAYESLRDSRK